MPINPSPLGDMSAFPSPKQLASWAGMCPGGDFYARRDPERTRKRLVTQLERLGYTVTRQREHWMLVSAIRSS